MNIYEIVMAVKTKTEGCIMNTAGLTRKIETLSNDEYLMVEAYVDSMIEYSKRRKKEAAWDRVKSDLMHSEERTDKEGGISSSQLRQSLGANYV